MVSRHRAKPVESTKFICWCSAAGGVNFSNRLLAHREEDDAIEALIRRGNSNSPTYPFSQTDEDLREMGEILKRKLGSSGSTI